MQKTILCTIDFSKASHHALKCAVVMAFDLRAHLTLLHTYRLIPTEDEKLFERKRKIEEDAIKNFSLVEKAFLRECGITYDFKTEIGFVADRVEAMAMRNHISFVVVDKDMTMSREAFDDLVQNMKVPMVIVP